MCTKNNSNIGVIIMKIKILTPENIEVEYSLAHLGSRTFAFIIDYTVESIMTIIIGVILWCIYRYAPFFWDAYTGWILGISLILFFIIHLGYYIVLEMNMNGKSLGKKIMKLRIIRDNGQPLTLKHSIIRNLFRVFIDIFGIGPVLMFLNKKHKRLGDIVASTIVVIEEDREQPVTLENLQKNYEGFNYHITQEEQDLLREYFTRKNELRDYEKLRIKLRLYFAKKFERQGILEEWKEFINSL